MESTTFDDLLHEAEQLTAEIDGQSELPRVERNLRQLLEAGEQLWTRTASGTGRDTTDVRASVLLGSKGYDLQKVTQQLDSLSAAKRLTPIETIAETDIKGFLRSERENSIMRIIADVKASTVSAADKVYLSNVQHDWEELKIKILNALVGPDDQFADFTSSFDMSAMRSQSRSPAVTPQPKLYFEQSFIDTSAITAMNVTETAFSREIVKYVDQTVFGAIRSNLANIFHNRVAKEIIGETLIIDLWEMVTTLLSSDIPLTSNADAFANRTSRKLQVLFMKNSRTYLEKKFIVSIQGTVLGETRSMSQTSVPVLYNLIKNYLNIKSPMWSSTSLNASFGSSHAPIASEDGLVDGQPIWCFIWHCLRCGSVDAAIEVAEKGPLWITKEFVPILREYKQSDERRLTQKTENYVRLSYKKSIRLSNDVYKRTVFSLLGCCGINDFNSDVFDKVDDFLWLRLSQVQIYDRDVETRETFLSPAQMTASDNLTFTKLQTQISEEYGESHFHAQDQPFTYFKALFLTLQWEYAIEFLFRVDSYRSHALHIAIVLNEIGLLLIPAINIKVPILSRQTQDPPKIQRLNYSKLINIYTKKFEVNNSVEAIYYLYLLRNIKTAKGENLFVASVSSLVRETKNYDTLLGYMSEDGCRVPGVIDKFHDNVSTIINQVADDLENSGLFEDAIKLYDLEAKHNKVLQLLNKMISAVVPERKVPDSKRSRLEIMALKIAERYVNGHNADRDVSGTFFLLIDLMTFFDYYYNQQYNDALDTISKLHILPFKNADIESKVNEFNQYSEEIRRNIPDILLATMNILYLQYKEIKSLAPRAVNKFGIVGDIGNKEQFAQEMRQKARTLITYTGMIPYRMPGDTNARLVQLEVMMN